MILQIPDHLLCTIKLKLFMNIHFTTLYTIGMGYTILLTVFQVLTVSSLCAATEYYVRPSEPIISCPGQPCLTIDYYTNNSHHYFKSNSVFIFLPGLHHVNEPVRFREIKNVSLHAYNNGTDIHLASTFACEDIASDNRLDVEQTSMYCSVIIFENVDGVFVKGITVSSMAPGVSATVLMQTTNAQLEFTSFTCLHEYSQVLSNGVLIFNSYNTVLYFIYATNCSNGVAVINSNYTVIAKLTVKNNKNGVYVNSTLHTSITNMVAAHNTEGGMVVEWSHNTTITNASCYQSGEDGVIVFLSNRTHLENVSILHSGIFGMYIGGSNFTIIMNSTSAHNKQDGIFFETTVYVIVSNTVVNYNNKSGITMHNARNATISNSIASYNFNGIMLLNTYNVCVSHTVMRNSSGHSEHRLGSGMWVENSDILNIFDVTVLHSTLYGIVVGQSNASCIENVTVRDSSYSGIFLSYNKNNLLRNVTVLQSNMDIVLHHSVGSSIFGAVVTSTEMSRGLTMFSSNSTHIEDMSLLRSTSTNTPMYWMDTTQMYPDAVLIINSTNATMSFNLTALSRGMTLYNSQNMTIYGGNFSLMKPLAIVSDPTSQPSIIMLYYSSLTLSHCKFTMNDISAIKLFSSDLTLVGITHFINNTAQSGTGFILSKDSHVKLSRSSHTFFENNHAANTGGVFYISTNMHYYAYYANTIATLILADTSCFLQVEGNRSESLLTFTNNTAGYAGDLIYGGQIAYGWDGDWNCFLGFKNISSTRVSPKGNLSLISSTPSRVCLCNANKAPDCLQVLSSQAYSIYPGQTINISAVVTGQGFGTAAGSVYAQFLKLSPSHMPPQLDSWQYTQGVTQRECNNLFFTVSLQFNRNESKEVLVLTVDESQVSTMPSQERVEQTTEMWKSTFYNKSNVKYMMITKEIYEYPVYINITLLPCPFGFQLTTKQPHRCDCNQLLQALPGVECHIQQLTIIRSGFIWVGVTEENGSETVTTSEYCPLGYCHREQWNTSLRDPNTQCNDNRAGILCGGCQPGLSLTLGSSHCQRCSNTYLALVLPFCLAGIALVMFIKILDMTISQGTINGLILYANIIQAKKYIFLSETTTPLTIFIAWLNLDVGVKTCFFHGLTALTKTWLQFVFPIYVWSIAGIIIFIAKYSDRMAKAMGNNSVPVLATLFLLSYTKLLSAIITALSYTVVYTSHGSKIVWSADGNVDYLGSEHTPLFAVALAALLFLWIPYTLLLFLGQWLQRCNLRLIVHLLIKLKPFLDAHYGPLKGNHRYWFGVLLLVRATILLVSALSPADNFGAAVYSISISCALLTYVGLLVYHNISVAMFETSFFVNLGLIAQTSLLTTVYGGKENIGANVLIGIAFAQFVGLVLYKILMITKLKERVQECLGKRSSSEEDWENWEQAALLREAESGSEDGEEMVLSPSSDMGPTYGF